ncbi:hypothetical protein FQN57_001795 [Myotisia sp. PD_48]|nr:hypothetical protein FQN57_001795 [Myotisia sp. PD_48]
MSTLEKSRLLVVSNRLPVSIKRTNSGDYEATKSGGGLVTSLSGISESIGFRWFGWPGLEIPEEDQDKVRDLLAKQKAVPIFYSKELADNHYNGFSNSVLWPVFHYQPGVQSYNEDWQKAYFEVNQRVAETISKEASDGDIIWVHDYHLMLLPRMLREQFAQQGKGDVKIGFSLHTPFPAPEVYRALPIGRPILEGILNSDLIGFHTDDYVEHFVQACHRILDLPIEKNTVRYKDRDVHVGKFVVGINPSQFYDALKSDTVRNRINQLDVTYRGMKRIIGIDRLDYIKGLPEKIRGFGKFLSRYPKWAGKIVLIQIAFPSREDVPEYQQLESEINQLVGKINGEYGNSDYTPLVFVHRSIPFEELVALYATADICLLSSTRDGMNLVASEYIACQNERHGVLALSEFAGASSFLETSVKFNPFNVGEVAEAIHRAAEMSDEDRKKDHERLVKFIDSHTSTHWGNKFVEELSGSGYRTRSPVQRMIN